MKITDNYNAKYIIWAKEQKIMALPKMILPLKFTPQKFQSYKEMNNWKKALIIKIAKLGGVTWSK